MNRKDLALIGSITVLAGLISLMLASVLFNNAVRHDMVPVVQPISSQFPDTKNDTKYTSFFNSNAIDPTQQIKIGDQTNNDPFKSPQ